MTPVTGTKRVAQLDWPRGGMRGWPRGVCCPPAPKGGGSQRQRRRRGEGEGIPLIGAEAGWGGGVPATPPHSGHVHACSGRAHMGVHANHMCDMRGCPCPCTRVCKHPGPPLPGSCTCTAPPATRVHQHACAPTHVCWVGGRLLGTMRPRVSPPLILGCVWVVTMGWPWGHPGAGSEAGGPEGCCWVAPLSPTLGTQGLGGCVCEGTGWASPACHCPQSTPHPRWGGPARGSKKKNQTLRAPEEPKS